MSGILGSGSAPLGVSNAGNCGVAIISSHRGFDNIYNRALVIRYLPIGPSHLNFLYQSATGCHELPCGPEFCQEVQLVSSKGGRRRMTICAPSGMGAIYCAVRLDIRDLPLNYLPSANASSVCGQTRCTRRCGDRRPTHRGTFDLLATRHDAWPRIFLTLTAASL